MVAISANERDIGATLRDLYGVFKLRIGMAITLCALAGVAVTPGSALPAWKIVVLALAVLLSSASAGAFNQYVERDLDARMDRTRGRPFVTGAYSADWRWLAAILAILAVAVGGAVAVLGAMVGLYVFLGAFVYGVVYTVWLKQSTWLNIVVGGLSGSFAVLAGAAAVDPTPGSVPLILAAVLFLWTPPHFWSLAMALREDYARAGVPMLPVVVGDLVAAKAILAHTVVLVIVSLLPAALGLGWVYLLGAALGGALFVRRSVQLVRQPGPRAAMVNFRASLIQLSLLLGAAILDAGLSI